MRHSGGLAPLAPVWADDRLILVLPGPRRLVMALLGAPFAFLSLYLGLLDLTAGLLVGAIGIAVVTTLLASRRRTVLRIERDALRIDDVRMPRTRLTGIGVDVESAFHSSILLQTSVREHRLPVNAPEGVVRSLARVLRAWMDGPTPTWGSPAWFQALQPSSLQADDLGSLAPFTPEILAEGVRLHLRGSRWKSIMGATGMSLALLAMGISGMLEVSGVAGGMTLGTHAVATLLLLPVPLLGLGGAALIAVDDAPVRRLDLTPGGVRCRGFRTSYAQLRDVVATGNRLVLTGPRGTTTLRHPDADALVELQERLLALRGAAREGGRPEAVRALRGLTRARRTLDG